MPTGGPTSKCVFTQTVPASSCCLRSSARSKSALQTEPTQAEQGLMGATHNIIFVRPLEKGSNGPRMLLHDEAIVLRGVNHGRREEETGACL